MALTAPLPPSRATGDTPAGGIAGDVNLLRAAIVELRGLEPVSLTQAEYDALVAAGTVVAGRTYYIVAG